MFEELDVLSGGMQASPGALKSYMEAQKKKLLYLIQPIF
jgi:hypothetical protein